KQTVSAVVIQFSQDFIKNFLPLQEFKNIFALLTASQRGLFFPQAKALFSKMEALPDLSGMEKVTALLTILQQLTTLEHQKLCSEYFHAIRGEKTEKRINKVCL